MMRVDVTGTKEIAFLLEKVAPAQGVKIARNAVHAVASDAAKSIKRDAPEATGALKKQIRAKRQRMRFGYISSRVEVASRGFYWFLLEFGTSTRAATPFIMPVVRALEPRLPEIWQREFVKKLRAAIKREQKRLRLQGGG